MIKGIEKLEAAWDLVSRRRAKFELYLDEDGEIHVVEVQDFHGPEDEQLDDFLKLLDAGWTQEGKYYMMASDGDLTVIFFNLKRHLDEPEDTCIHLNICPDTEEWKIAKKAGLI